MKRLGYFVLSDQKPDHLNVRHSLVLKKELLVSLASHQLPAHFFQNRDCFSERLLCAIHLLERAISLAQRGQRLPQDLWCMAVFGELSGASCEPCGFAVITLPVTNTSHAVQGGCRDRLDAQLFLKLQTAPVEIISLFVAILRGINLGNSVQKESRATFIKGLFTNFQASLVILQRPCVVVLRKVDIPHA